MLRPVDVIVFVAGLAVGLWVWGVIRFLRQYAAANRAANGVPRAGIPRRPKPSAHDSPAMRARALGVPLHVVEHAPYGDGGLDDSYDKPYFVDTVPIAPVHPQPTLTWVNPAPNASQGVPPDNGVKLRVSGDGRVALDR